MSVARFTMKNFSERTDTGLLPSMAQRIAVLTFQIVSKRTKRRVKLSARVLGAVLFNGMKTSTVDKAINHRPICRGTERHSSRPWWPIWGTGIHYRVLLFVLLLCATSGCTIRSQSVIPKTIVSTQASFDNNVQNSGVIGIDGKGGFIVTPHLIARWDALTAKYGNRFTPPIPAGDRRGIEERVDSFSVTSEVMANFRIMNFYRRAEQSGP